MSHSQRPRRLAQDAAKDEHEENDGASTSFVRPGQTIVFFLRLAHLYFLGGREITCVVFSTGTKGETLLHELFSQVSPGRRRLARHTIAALPLFCAVPALSCAVRTAVPAVLCAVMQSFHCLARW